MDQQNTPHSRQSAYSDEIDLFELLAVLWGKKWWIVIVTGVFAGLSIFIALSIKPVYQASVHFLPPLRQDAEQLNVEAVGTSFSQDNLYAEFQRNFRSRSNLWEFFSENELYNAYLKGDFSTADIDHVFENMFVQKLVLDIPNAKKADVAFVSASLDWHDKEAAAILLNQYVRRVAEHTSMQLLNELGSLVLNRKARLLQETSALKKSAENALQRRVLRLDEDIFIARKLGIKRGSDSRGGADASSIFVDASGKQPYYYLGYEVLEVEREAILNRKNNDPFVIGLEEKLIELDYLNALQLPDSVRVVRVSRQAAAPKTPVKPNKKLIVVVGIMLGGVVALLLAFLSHALDRRRISGVQ